MNYRVSLSGECKWVTAHRSPQHRVWLGAQIWRKGRKKIEGIEWRWANAEKGDKNTERRGGGSKGSYFWGGKPLTLGINNHKKRKSACNWKKQRLQRLHFVSLKSLKSGVLWDKNKIFSGREGRCESFSNGAGWLYITPERADTNSNARAAKNIPAKKLKPLDRKPTNQKLQIFGIEFLPELYFLRREINGWLKTNKGFTDHCWDKFSLHLHKETAAC
jgi:hypothetical protein